MKALLSMLLFCSIPFFSLAANQSKEDTTEYSNRFDESLTFKKVSYLPSVDNVNGVYAKSVDKKLEELIIKNHHWDFVPTHVVGSVVSPEELVTDPKKVLSISTHLNTDALFIAEIRKDPKALKAHLYLFSAKSGELVTEETIENRGDTTPILLSSLDLMMRDIIEKIPYDALIISRTDNRVTINAGKKDGVRVGQNLNGVKIIGAKKHPKRNFLIKSQKALIGQVRVVKVDKYLSFADIVSESEPGVLDQGVKITGITRAQYNETPWTKTYTPPEQLLSENNKSVFGKKAREWIAKDPPTFGKIGADFSIGSFDNSLALTNDTTVDSKVSFYPRINVNGEVWITPNSYAEANFAQGIGQADNPSGGDEISNSLTQYRLSFGYNFILRNEFFGPKLTFDAGFSSYKMFVDTTSTAGFTTLHYRSIPIGIGGYVPINPSETWAIGGKAWFHLFPRLKESPFASGSDPDSNINHFNFYAENKISQRLRWKVGLEFLLLSTSFSPTGGGRTTPASNLSHRFTMLTTGINYLF